MPIPIRDLEVSEVGVRATLHFGWRGRLTFVPWTAVFVVSGTTRGVYYVEDCPPEVRTQLFPTAPPPQEASRDGEDDLFAGQVEARPLVLRFDGKADARSVAEIMVAVERACGEPFEIVGLDGGGAFLEVQVAPASGLGRDRWREIYDWLIAGLGAATAELPVASAPADHAMIDGRLGAEALTAELSRTRIAAARPDLPPEGPSDARMASLVHLLAREAIVTAVIVRAEEAILTFSWRP
jgi:hypothetical protein